MFGCCEGSSKDAEEAGVLQDVRIAEVCGRDDDSRRSPIF